LAVSHPHIPSFPTRRSSDLGRAELQYLPYLNKGKKIVIEPSRKEWFKQLFVGHLQGINSVAVTSDINDPNIVSVSDDATARVWRDRKSTRLNSSHGSISYAV